jgi:hypothetical protein
MKRIAMLLVFSLVLWAGPFSLRAYDFSPDKWKVVPECIWAPATGGGEWVTEIQITNTSLSTATSITVWFMYAGGTMRGPFTLISSLGGGATAKFSNILSTVDGIDAGVFTYYGRVGAIWFQTNLTSLIEVTAKTVNGDYGKTFPGLSPIVGTTAAVDRPMMIHSLTNNATYRTFAGFANTSGSLTTQVTFYIITPGSWTYIGSSFTKTIPPMSFVSFNPFVEAGISAGAYDNYWLWINPTSGPAVGDARGLMCFGAIANNNSNDPAALIAYPWIGTSGEPITALPSPSNE